MKNNNEKSEFFVRVGRILYSKYPILRPYLTLVKKMFFSRPKFSGWGITTINEPPWFNIKKSENFNKSREDIKEIFQFGKKQGINKNQINGLDWRHWIVNSATKYSIKFAKSKEKIFVECGVGWGMSAFFALRELVDSIDKQDSFFMHLYDSWSDMKEDDLLENELWHVNQYSSLNIESTKKHLSEFNDYLIYHHGYIPDSFLDESSKKIKIISYLHIDLNSAKPTKDTLEFFYPKLVSGGVILFDDYGWDAYKDSRNVIDEFLESKPGILIEFPTGQAIYFQK